ncbi:DUF490 domain-containing protein [Trinickia caryophylli]|nr:DUF490 domain-containing protein [Trinickia caryophylli]
MLRGLGIAVFALVALALAAVLALYGAVTTERGTRLVWRAAVAVSGGRLTGTLEGGTLAQGLRLSDVHWAQPGPGGGTDIRIDRLSGRWALTRAPWRFTIEDLSARTIEARLAPSQNNAPMVLPQSLRLPLELDIRSVYVGKLRLIDGKSAAEYGGLRLAGRSDGRHHTLSLGSLDTPYGAVDARLALDGVRPFALSGDARYAGKLENEPVSVAARLGGTLEALSADIDATGFKLKGRAHVEAKPFASVVLERATLSFAHVDPRAFSPGAPAADLSLDAQIAPVPGAGTFTVAGPVSIVNARPGRLDAGLLPLIDARAEVRLDAREERIAGLRIRLVDDATLVGGGTLRRGRGRIDLQAAGLDLNTLAPAVRPTALEGPIGITLDGPTQALEFDLADKRAGLGARAKVSLEPSRIALRDVRVTAGAGRAELEGTLARDAESRYSLRATLAAFDPRLVLAATQAGAKTRAAAAARRTAAVKPRASASGSPTKPGMRASTSKQAVTGVTAWPEARVTGTFAAEGALAPVLTTKLRFALGPSVYDGLPLTGAGTLQVVGQRLLPSEARLSIAGNDVELNGSFGTAADRLRFHVAAPHLERLGFGVAGAVLADGDVTGSLAHPNVTLSYDARGVAFGENRVGSAQGRALLRDGANGALELTTQARDVHTGIADLAALSAHVTGTRARHAFDASAKGTLRGRPIDLALAASGGLADTRDGPRWSGTVTRLTNTGMPALELQAPLSVTAARDLVSLGATRLALEGARLDLRSLAYDHGTLRSAGSVSALSVARLLAIREELTGTPSRVRSDLVFAGDWDFSLGRTATGYARLARVSGDLSVDTGRGGLAPLGITALAARAEFGAGNRLAATLHAAASRIGTADARVGLPLTPDRARGGLLGVSADAPLDGTIAADVPSLKTTGGLFGPSYLLDGRLALKLAVAGTAAKPALSGSLTGDSLSATFVDQGVQLKDGVIRIALSENLVDFQRVEFHGGDGTLRATGKIRLDAAEPDLTAQIVADKLALFAAPDRQLSLSGSATVANGGAAGGIDIDGRFRVDHALFDMPEQPAPQLSDDVVIVRNNAVVRGSPPPMEPAMNKPVGRFAPRANVDIDLGRDFRFRGRGADLGLRGTVTMLSAPNQPLRAVGNVRVTEGSTYTQFGRKLGIENGYFTFNGPVANPGVNILAMRRNQEVEAGVQVTGTVNTPAVKLVSEPNVPDDEKLSWLLFGHGTDQGNNLGQQSSMTTALALLGSATGKRVAQTFGLDEFTVGRSDVGLTDPEVIMISKAINERLVFGYEQGLQSASNAFKATINLSRFWSVSAYTGTFQGVDIDFTRRFDGFGSRR